MDNYVWDNFDPVLIENWDVSAESGSNGTSPLSSPILELNFLEPSSDLLDLPIDVRTQLSPELLQSSCVPHICISEDIFANTLASELKPVKEDIPVLEPAKRGRPKKKRQRSGAEESTDITAVVLTREQLLKFSSQDLDDFARTVACQRPLTTAEEKELKRQRRLIKNRESAQASRERKRVFVDDLQGHIDELEVQLKKRDNEILLLKQENVSLKQKISELLGMSSSNAVVTSNSPIVTSNNNDSHIVISDMFSIKSSNTVSVNKVKSAGVTLLIMLFSFGLLFNAFGNHKLVNLGKESTISHNLVLPPASIYNSVNSNSPSLSHSAPISSSSSLLRNLPPTTVGRSLQEHSSPVSEEGDLHVNNKQSTPVIDRSTFEELRESKRGDVSPVHNTKSIQEDSITSIFLHEFANESKDSLDHKRLSEEAQQLNDWFNNNIDIQNNTAYLLTDEVQQLIHKDPAPFDISSPLKISLLIPSHHHTSIADSDNILLEVHCEVLDIKGHQVTANLVPKLSIAQ